jgi:hypothetical protein
MSRVIASFSAVLDRTPTAIPRAPRAALSGALPSRAMATVSASTSVSPSSAADPTTPRAPSRCCTNGTAIRTAWKASAILSADQSPRGLRASSGTLGCRCSSCRRYATTNRAVPTTSTGIRYGTSARAMGALSTAAMRVTRGMSRVHAPSTPNANACPAAGCSRLRREKCKVTAVDETSPPSSPKRL